MAFLVGTSRIGCAAGRVYTWSGESASGSGLFMAWAVDFWVFSIFSFPLPSSVSIREVSSFFSHGQIATPMSEGSKFSTRPACGCYRHGSSTMVSL